MTVLGVIKMLMSQAHKLWAPDQVNTPCQVYSDEASGSDGVVQRLMPAR